jgi:hypothetical protein
MTQSEWVLHTLKKGIGLTPIDALNGCGCFRLAAIVFDLKQGGWNIQTAIVKDPATKKRYALYTLESLPTP